MNDKDFWFEASSFLKTQLPANFEDNLSKHIKSKNYNRNEILLFNSMMKDVVAFTGTIVLIKSQL